MDNTQLRTETEDLGIVTEKQYCRYGEIVIEITDDLLENLQRFRRKCLEIEQKCFAISLQLEAKAKIEIVERRRHENNAYYRGYEQGFDDGYFSTSNDNNTKSLKN